MSQSDKLKELEQKFKDHEIEKLKETIRLRFDVLDQKLKESDEKISVMDGTDTILPELENKDSFKKYLNEFAEGKHLNDPLLGSLLAFESKHSKAIEKFLNEMKAEPLTELCLMKELLLGCCTFSRENTKQMK